MGLVPALQKQSFLTTESYLKQVMDCCSCFLLAFVKMFSAVMLFWRTVIFIHELGVGHVVATKDQMKIARLTIYLLIVQIFILCRCFVLKNGAIFNMSILPQWINNQLFRSRDKFQRTNYIKPRIMESMMHLTPRVLKRSSSSFCCYCSHDSY